MSLICVVKRTGVYNYILEDPDTRYNRIFIENQSHDVTTLNPRFGEFFFHVDVTDNALNASYSADWSDYPYVDTVGHNGLSWSNGRQDWVSSIGIRDPWLLVLDYTYPTQRIVRDLETQHTYVFYPRDLTTSNIRQDIWTGENMNSIATYRATTDAYYLLPLYRRSDGYWVGIDMDNGASWVTQIRLRPTSVTISTIRSVGSKVIFFIGRGSNNAGYFLEVDGTTSAYEIFMYPDWTNTGGTIGTSASGLSVVSGIGGSVSNYCPQFPSNIVDPTLNRKVFYSSHWDSTFNLAPQRIVFNNATNEFYATTCTMVYASGTYTNYATIPNNNNFGTAGNNSWWIKPHAFTTASTNYITFCTTEKCISLYPTERWTTSTQRAWVTYSIGSGTDDHILTYHSRIVWPRAEDMPRSWVPTNIAGYQMVVFQTGRTSTLNFNTGTGWQISNIQDLDTRAYGLDSLGRLYCVTRGQAGAQLTGATASSSAWNNQGYNAIWLYDPGINGNNTTVTIPTNRYNFDGTPYNTTATVDISYNKFVAQYRDASFSTLNPFSTTNTATGYSSWKFDGTDDRLMIAPSNDWCFGKGDFTVEFWLYSNVAWSSQTNLAGIVGCKVNDASRGWQISRYASGGTGPWLRMFGSTDFTCGFSVGTQIWEHWALTRSGTTIRWYKNGVADFTTLTVSTEMDLFDYNAPLFVGWSQTWSAGFNGYISNLRIVKGLAVYSGANNFTSPALPFTARQSAGTNIAEINTQTVLLTCQDQNLTDFSTQRIPQEIKLNIIGTGITFDDDSIGPYTVITSSTQASSVIVKVVSTGSAYITVSSTT